MSTLGLYHNDPLWLRSEIFVINHYTTKELVFSSPEPKAHRRAYSIPMVRRSSSVVFPQCSNIFFSETTWPIKAKFYMEPPWVVERNFVRGIWVT